MSASQRATRLLAGVAACLSGSGCHYDIDKIYSYADDTQHDGGSEAGEEPLPADLIDMWPAGSLSEECVACAKEKCGDVNAGCRDDAECAALTRCVAKAENPADQYDCRAEHVEWLSQSIQERDIGGPYQQCVFLSACAGECDAHSQLACTGNYDWPMSNSNVPLHLRFVEGLESNPVAGLSVRACRTENPLECQPTDSTEHLTDDDGVVNLEVQPSLGGFQGYLELSGAGIYPSLLRFGWPIAKEVVTNVAVVSQTNVSLLAFSSEVKLEEDRGLLQLRAFGCYGISTRDVSFAVLDGADDKTGVWYTTAQDLLPNFDATGTADRGAGGIVNVLPGRRRVTASHEGDLIASLSAPVRAGHMTIIVLLPADSL